MSSTITPVSLKSAVSQDALDAPQTEYPQAPETPERGRELSASPVLTIQARRWWAGLDLREVWLRRDLLYLLAWRDVKVRYKQTVLGAAWAVLQPLLTMVVFTLFFGKLARVPSDGIPYPIFAYAGLLPWTFFSNAVTSGGNSLISNAALVTKVYFPRMIIPGAAVCAGLVDFGIASLILIGLMAYYGVALGAGAAMLIPLAMLTTTLAIGVGMGMSALNVKYRDVRHAMPFAIQLWMFATPIIYPSSLIPPKWRWLLWANPLSGVIEGFRAALFHRAFNWPALAVSTAVAVVVLVCSACVFRQMEREFADVI